MNIHPPHRVLFAVIVCASFVVVAATSNAQTQTKQQVEQEKIDAKSDKDKRERKKSESQKTQPEQTKDSQKPVQQPQTGNEQRKPMQVQERQKQKHERAVVAPASRNQQAAQRPATQKHADSKNEPPRSGYKNNAPVQKLPTQSAEQKSRLPKQQQLELIQQQQQRVVVYHQNVAKRQAGSGQHSAQLLQQKRTSQYQYQKEYYERLRQQQLRYKSEPHDYNNDPYFYTASSYRYNRGGRYYQTNQYGANILRQALNYGYQEGMRAGRADSQDGWRYSYRDSYIYQDANYGYSGYYVQQDDYNYYFRQGFQRGYEDGYYVRRKYGRSYNGSDSLLSAVLVSVLGLQSIR